jgi:UDP-2-acetamido-2-deoxy-ribo-hexuluronate aminotransferase
MVDLHMQYLRMKGEIDEAIQNVLTSASFIQGEDVEVFATNLSKYTGAEFVIPCANGTDALQIAMMALDLRPGDEVILPVHTYAATAEVVALLGLKPIFVDVDEDTFNINVNQIEEKITPSSKAIVPVHLYGQCADMVPVLALAKKHNLFVIEDAAQSLGAKYCFPDGEKKQAGTMGIIGTTSFFPSKNLGAYGDAGAIFTNDSILAEKIKMIANHGQRKKYYHDLVGVNSRLDTLQAAILNVKLKYLPDFEKRRSNVASHYDNAISSDRIELPYRAAYSSHVFHQYTVKVRSGRDKLAAFLRRHDIPSMIYYPLPLHFQNAYRRSNLGAGIFPVAEKLANHVLSLPIHTEMTTNQLDYICQVISDWNE